ncbi:sulfite reductase (NADPH) flavoprotein alpha-component [Herbaspirillum sp. Sphag1AN]|uniref:PepSY domain-containing protein n=1 Tax=unclassified Herbaspirillum TaxID=2624150 RepID=UPI00161791F3|nr:MULTISPECIES: PepSY domain-containing protein [unclassified Herbaspirillum]MBB3214046.1 sulfite reductase (NADPH) flavoprotein alpha-component [Herbaspirillum sp. Sphag1AN]MBB3247561.1 sulfite reductase (NADPH) flavoprotein alpha-component [Herbaspirillum sp. Sphag64]
MFKKIWFQVHWFIGITAGTVLMAIGVSGAILSFSDEIIDWINPGIVHVTVQQSPMLTPPQLLAQLQATLPERRVSMVTVYATPGASARIMFTPPPGVRRGEMRYVDPYNGTLLAAPQGAAFFQFIERFHRWLLLPVETGKIISGSLSLCLLLLALSGLYLRWPRRIGNWRAWFKLDFGLSGRSFLWNLHSVVGTWLLVMYVIFAGTGAYWSFDWVKLGVNTLAGESMPKRPGEGNGRKQSAGERGDKRNNPAETAPVPDLNVAWNSFVTAAGPTTMVNLRIPDKAGEPVQFNYLTDQSPHERARNRMSIAVQNGEIKQVELYADKSRGSRFVGAIYPLHMGSYFGLPGRIIMTLAALLMPLFGITGWMLYLDRRRKKKAIRAQRAKLSPSRVNNPDNQASDVLLAYASQSGHAERLALQTAAMLQQTGVAIRVRSLATLELTELASFRRALYIISTFGEGEPPDPARPLAAKLSAAIKGNKASPPAQLHDQQFAVLALGDRGYPCFCGFGHQLDNSLRELGATPLFPLIELDGEDPAALAQWQQALTVFSDGRTLTPVTQQLDSSTSFMPWTLRSRSVLNPGSCGQPLYHLELEADAGITPHWHSGALAEIAPRHRRERVSNWLLQAGLDGALPVHLGGEQISLAEALARSELPPVSPSVDTLPQGIVDQLKPLGTRRYSISSIASDGRLHLLVRQVRQADGVELGVGSGWLTTGIDIGDQVALRIVENPQFSLIANPAPAIFIGNGSGMAGLRAHLRARAAQGHQSNWLLFGERQRACDFLYQNEITAWQNDGTLNRVDLAFSRDQPERIYVQEKLRHAADQLQAWLHEGAVVYVCGSLQGMAAGVDAVLTDIIGATGVQELIRQGRYRRDVY